jgi:hypothetical protein
VPRRWLVPGLLLVVSATPALSASTGIVQAVEECRLEPGWQAPPGSKWLSRINRDHHRCWFLSSSAVGGHHTQLHRAAPVRSRHLAGDTDAVRQGQQRDSDLQTASAPKDKTDFAVTAEPPGVPQVGTPSVEQSSENLIPHSVPTIAYSLSPPSAQMVSGPTAVAARTAEQTPAGASESNMVLLAGAAAGLLAEFFTSHVAVTCDHASALSQIGTA